MSELVDSREEVCGCFCSFPAAPSLLEAPPKKHFGVILLVSHAPIFGRGTTYSLPPNTVFSDRCGNPRQTRLKIVGSSPQSGTKKEVRREGSYARAPAY
ncbi:hypothetical protein HMPREF3152_04610 [Actinomyces sp. HMSC06A08]|nr:hypothetical protein HMPREF3152_04610 [Actinomyces sp. HMSC06A08]